MEKQTLLSLEPPQPCPGGSSSLTIPGIVKISQRANRSKLNKTGDLENVNDREFNPHQMGLQAPHRFPTEEQKESGFMAISVRDYARFSISLRPKEKA